MKLRSGGSAYNSDRPSDEYICINSCGCHALLDTDLTIRLPEGRSDYQLIYLWKGSASFRFDGQETQVCEGDLVLYKPWQAQHYTYRAQDGVEAYYVHVTGRGIHELLQKSHLWAYQTCHVGKLGEIPQMMARMIREIQLKTYQYEMFCNAYFLDLLASISRRLMQQQNEAIDRKYEGIVIAIEKMHQDFQKNESMGSYAQYCHMSFYHFVHQFKAYTGLSPHAYQTQIRMDKAKDLLANTTLNIAEIANAVGYENPLYFSRIFKSSTGFSPTLFRRCL